MATGGTETESVATERMETERVETERVETEGVETEGVELSRDSATGGVEACECWGIGDRAGGEGGMVADGTGWEEAAW